MTGDRWGVSESETLRPYPCDDFIAAPVLRALTAAVAVNGRLTVPSRLFRPAA